MSALNSSAARAAAEPVLGGSPLVRSRNVLLAAGVVGLLAAVILAFTGDGGAGLFYESWLYAFLVWIGATLGCFVLLTVVHMAGGSWGAMIMRPLEAGVATLPLMAVLLIPVLLGIGHLYDWSDPAYRAASPLVGAKDAMLNTPFFIVRSILYFVIWILGGYLLLRGSDRADADPSGSVWFRLKSAGTVWLPIYVITFTFAAIDWGMSLDPEWFSGIYPTIMMAGHAITGIAVMILAAISIARFSPRMDELLTEKRLQDLGNFLMAFMMFWAYVSISQLMIIWSNNTLETSPYYVARLSGSWETVAMVLTAFGFFAPFVILFSRWVKRKRLALGLVALWALASRMLDMYWITIPSFERAGPDFQWLDIILLLGMGALWAAYFVHRLAARPLLPANDPRLEGAQHGH